MNEQKQQQQQHTIHTQKYREKDPSHRFSGCDNFQSL